MEIKIRYCHKHPKEVAIRDCSECLQPICRICIRESNNPRLCPDCEARKGFKAQLERETLELAEITVTDEEAAVDKKATIREDERLKERQTEPAQKAPAPKLDETPGESTSAEPPGEISLEEIERRAAERRRKSAEPGIPLEPAGRVPRSVFRQLLSVLPAGVAAALWSAIFWGCLGLITHTRANVAVIFTGLLISYVLIKASTRKKDQRGRLVWTLPPPPALTGLLGLILTAAVLPLMEFIFYRGILRGYPQLRLGFGAYWTSEFMGALDYVLIGLGLMVAFLLPFLWELSLNRSKR